MREQTAWWLMKE